MSFEEFGVNIETSEAEKSQFPDINMPGNLVFCGYMTKERLYKKFTLGIRKRGGVVRPASYFPGQISLSATSDKGYKESTGIQMGWTTLYFSALNNGIYDNSFRIALVLQPEWIRNNLNNLLGVGAIFKADRQKHVIAGPIKNLPIASKLDESAFFEEVHCSTSPIPPSAITGIIIHDDEIFNLRRALVVVTQTIEKAIETRGIDGDIAIYDLAGKILKIVKGIKK